MVVGVTDRRTPSGIEGKNVYSEKGPGVPASNLPLTVTSVFTLASCLCLLSISFHPGALYLRSNCN